MCTPTPENAKGGNEKNKNYFVLNKTSLTQII